VGGYLVVLPARLHSTRLPEKPLLRETGKYLIQHTWENARRAAGASRVVVATDDARIQRACEEFGAPCLLTSPDCASGTERVVEVARRSSEPILVNVQGDEPDIEPRAIERVAGLLEDDPGADMATLGTPFRSVEDWRSPHRVKVVVDARGDAIYFSRAPIPHGKDPDAAYGRAAITEGGREGSLPVGAGGTSSSDTTSPGAPSQSVREGEPPRVAPRREGPAVLLHVGVYAYRRELLLGWHALGPSILAEAEDLEQLRAIEHGVRIRVALTHYEGFGMDTRADYEKFVARQRGAS